MRQLLLLASLALLLTGCALGRETSSAADPLDSTLRAAGLTTGKLKIKGPVIFQVGGTGNTAAPTTTDNRKAGQRQGSAATAPHAVASTTTQQAGTKWYWFALIGVGSIVAWEWFTKNVRWPWRL